MITLTQNTKATVTFGVIGGLLLAGWGANAAFGSKADAADLVPIRADINAIKEQHARESAIQENILKLIEKMDQRMQRIEDNQNWQIGEEIKRRRNDQQPPAATPNPLGR